jgi:hypothetical protein
MSHPVLSPGDKNKAVIEAKKLTVAHLHSFKQDALADAINVKSTTYGPAAVKGIRYVQRRYKLKVDGVIGPNTWKVLEYARKPAVPIPVLVIMTRLQWDARTPRGVTKVNWTSTQPTRVHHTDTGVPTGSGKALVENEKEIIRAVQKYHMDSRKYNDIAYNFLIMPSGRVYEGRGKEVEGAHTLGHNEDCGIAFVGDYNKDKLTRAQIIAYKNLRRKLGVSGGKAYPHSATYNTSCPGTNVVKQLGL